MILSQPLRRYTRLISSLLILSMLLATLPGCGGGGGSAAGSPAFDPASLAEAADCAAQATANPPPIVTGAKGPAYMLQGTVVLTRPVAGATVTVYESNGAVAGTAITDANGAFTVFEPLAAAPAPVAAKGGAGGVGGGERRFVATVPSDAPEGAGTVLMADTAAPFAHLDIVATEVSLVRKAAPGLSLAAARARVAAGFGIPSTVDLEDVGGDASPFSNAQFEADAADYNQAHGKAGRSDLDLYLAAEAAAAPLHVAGDRTASVHLHRKGTGVAGQTAPLNQVQGLNADNTDPQGTLDPEQQQALDAWGASAFIPTASFTDEQLQEGTYQLFGTIAGISSTVIDGLSTIAGLKATLDAADGNTVERSTVWLSRIAGCAVIAIVITSIVLSILQANAEDPYLKGLQQLSQQIEQGFKALSQQIQQSTAFLRWNQSQVALQTTISNIQGRLGTLQNSAFPATAGFQPFDTAQQNVLQSTLNPQGSTYASQLANANNGLSGPNAVLDGIAAYTAQSTYTLAKSATTRHGAGKGADGLGYSLRDNATTLKLRGLEMQYANAISFAAQVDAYESRAGYGSFGGGLSRLSNFSNRLSGASTFGANGLNALRRRGLQQAPPRFASDKIRVDASRGLAWSTEVTAQQINSSVYTYEEKPGFGTISCYYTLDGGAFRRDGYRLDSTMARGWRLPTLSELRALPAWGTNDCLTRVKSEMGIDLNGYHYVAAYDPTALDPIVEKETVANSFFTYTVTRQVRFYDVTNGNEVAFKDARGANISCPAVFDMRSLTSAIDNPRKPGAPAIACSANAGPLDARVYTDGFPSTDIQTIESSAMRAAGVPPDDIRVIDHVIDNPWYSPNPILPQQQARKIHALSAVGIWYGNPAVGKAALIVDDLSGVVEWQTSDPAIARVTNSYSAWPSPSARAKANNKWFVSPWFSTLTFSKAGKVTVTAVWTQGVTSTTPNNTVTITEATSADLAIPPVLSALNVYPTGLLCTNASQLQGKVMSAYGELSDNTAADYNTKVQWSLLEVQLDGNGNETGTTPLSNTIATITQPSNLTAGGVLTINAGAGTTRRIRVVATDTTTGKTGKADFQLQL